MSVETRIISREICVKLWKAGETLSTAESCTSGQISSAITSVPGSSTYFKGGVVCYTNEVKSKLLGVDAELIEEKGAVSEEVVRAMVNGARKVLDTTYAIAVTGYAGPGGGDEASVGTIWVAVGDAEEIITRKLEGDEGRDVNLSRATFVALQMMLDLLKKRYPAEEE
ncbi:MAG: CinA family protein [Paraprevotella sp.]|nr:CinA family protein [Paraprevotella sp.]